MVALGQTLEASSHKKSSLAVRLFVSDNTMMWDKAPTRPQGQQLSLVNSASGSLMVHSPWTSAIFTALSELSLMCRPLVYAYIIFTHLINLLSLNPQLIQSRCFGECLPKTACSMKDTRVGSPLQGTYSDEYQM